MGFPPQRLCGECDTIGYNAASQQEYYSENEIHANKKSDGAELKLSHTFISSFLLYSYVSRSQPEAMDEDKTLKNKVEKANDSLKANQQKDSTTPAKPADPNAPVKVRKKPGRKPNPQSPAIRKYVQLIIEIRNAPLLNVVI